VEDHNKCICRSYLLINLDKLPEFEQNVLEVLRQLLGNKMVMIWWGQGTITYLANFTFVAAMKPCPCGY
jgi:predicted ATPase with chaperone activity